MLFAMTIIIRSVTQHDWKFIPLGRGKGNTPCCKMRKARTAKKRAFMGSARVVYNRLQAFLYFCFHTVHLVNLKKTCNKCFTTTVS